MKMLKLLGLTVFVVCIAAFASGCGGGGGGSSMAPETPTAPTTPTEPTTPAEPETPEPTITDIRATVLGILTNASELANRAAASATAIGGSEDVTDVQLSLAVTWHQNVRNALSQIVAANNLATSATTLEEAQQALSDARIAFTSLQSAQTELASIQTSLTPVAATPPTTPPTTPTEGATPGAFTNNSSLIQLVRDNKLLSDALLEDLVSAEGGNARLLVGEVGAGTAGTNGKAEFLADSGTGANRVVNVRTVQMQGITSDSKTPLLTGTGPLPHGFDLINDAETTFVNAYTDIAKTRTLTGDNPATQGVDETETATGGYELPDTDYLVAGIWLTVNAELSTSQIQAFAYGGQPITTTNVSASCTAADLRGSTTTRAVCTEATNNFHMISRFVADGKDVTATYRGNANGAYIAGGDTRYFTGSVELTAEFQNPKSDTPDATTPAPDGEGSIQGAITNIVAGGQPMAGSIELQKQDLGATGNRDQIHPIIEGAAVGVVDGKSFSGGWKGQFFGQRVTKSTVTNAVDEAPITSERTTTYKPQAPGSVAGTFQVIQKSNPADEAAFIGSFGAHR